LEERDIYNKSSTCKISHTYLPIAHGNGFSEKSSSAAKDTGLSTALLKFSGLFSGYELQLLKQKSE